MKNYLLKLSLFLIIIAGFKAIADNKLILGASSIAKIFSLDHSSTRQGKILKTKNQSEKFIYWLIYSFNSIDR